jgi:hypothetical protein
VASAATRSPSARTNASPGTTSAAGISVWSPSRITLARGALRVARAVTARSARTSWITPTVVFTTITIAMTTASVKSPTLIVRTTAAIKSSSSGSFS